MATPSLESSYIQGRESAPRDRISRPACRVSRRALPQSQRKAMADGSAVACGSMKVDEAASGSLRLERLRRRPPFVRFAHWRLGVPAVCGLRGLVAHPHSASRALRVATRWPPATLDPEPPGVCGSSVHRTRASLARRPTAPEAARKGRGASCSTAVARWSPYRGRN